MKGICTIQIIDDATKQVIQEVTDENMVTNAIRNVMNPSPLFFAKDGNYKQFVNGNFPIATTALGGVLLWSIQLPEDADYIIHNNALDLVGHAGNDAYSGYNQLRGSYNTTESGATDTGYKHVWDFSTNQGNGIIRCVSLTSAWGGKSGMLGTKGECSTIKPIDTGHDLDANKNMPPVMNDIITSNASTTQIKNNTFFQITKNNADPKSVTVRKYHCEFYNAKTATPVSPNLIEEFIVKHSSINVFAYFGNNDKIYWIDDNLVWWRYVSSKLRSFSINLSSKSVSYKENNLTGDTPAQQESNIWGCYKDNKFYYQDYSTYNIFEIDTVTNVSKKIGIGNQTWAEAYDTGFSIAFIQFNNYFDSQYNTFDTLHYINGEWYTGNSKIYPSNAPQSTRYYTEELKAPFVQAIGSYNHSQGGTSIHTAIFAPYIATIDNLSTPVTKTASQSMKVIYTLTDV